jgi:hypothetical protein
VRECSQCRADLEAGQRVVEAVERTPRLSPSPLFAHRVMAHVNVYEPWHVAARDSLDRWAARAVPRSRPLRVVAAAGGLSIAALLSVASVWLAGHLDAVFFFGTLVRTRLRDALLEQLGIFVSTVFGPGSVDALRAGGPTLVFTVLGTGAVLIVAAGLAVRSAVASTRRGRV